MDREYPLRLPEKELVWAPTVLNYPSQNIQNLFEFRLGCDISPHMQKTKRQSLVSWIAGNGERLECKTSSELCYPR